MKDKACEIVRSVIVSLCGTSAKVDRNTRLGDLFKTEKSLTEFVAAVRDLLAQESIDDKGRLEGLTIHDTIGKVTDIVLDLLRGAITAAYATEDFTGILEASPAKSRSADTSTDCKVNSSLREDAPKIEDAPKMATIGRPWPKTDALPAASMPVPAAAPTAFPVRENPGAATESWVRVFYVTDRKGGYTQNSLQYGSQRSSEGRLSYGECTVSIPKVHRLGKLESPSLLKFEFRPDPKKHITLEQVEPLHERIFFKKVEQSVSRAPARDAFVFVHGYCVSFEDAARRTGQIAFDLHFVGAPIFYSSREVQREAVPVRYELGPGAGNRH